LTTESTRALSIEPLLGIEVRDAGRRAGIAKMPSWADGPMKRAGAHGAVLFWRFSILQPRNRLRRVPRLELLARRDDDKKHFPLSPNRFLTYHSQLQFEI
jgi:hypothetical protein